MPQSTPELPTSDDPVFDLNARDWGSALGLGVVAVTLVLMSPSVPIASLVVLGAAAVVHSAPLGFVIGQIACIPVVSGISPLTGVVQLGLLAVLTEPTRSPRDTTTLGLSIIAWVVLIALVVGTTDQGLLVTGGLVCLAVGGSVYVTYRVTLVRLDLVTVGAPDDDSNLNTKG
ncbi:hypothetical protein [Halorubrum coriense]|uniref:hypothetical protein n=1 Tax=Halorubrum coriense TaxID=64713 RepID=UPI000677F966|nr:hypothetical protein [Halorubrum coriense]